MGPHTTAFAERLFVPWPGWLFGVGAAALVAAQIGMGSIVTWPLAAVLLPVAAAAVWLLGRIRVRVEQDEFRVDDARLPLRFVAAAEPLDRAQLRDALTAQLHPLAFVVQRPWIRTAVRVELNDPEDPTPYWIVSTRRPERLCAALRPREGASTVAG